MTRNRALALAFGLSVMLAAAFPPPASAACSGGGIIEIALGGSLYLDVPYGNPFPGGYNYYPTLTAGRQEVYWKLGAGDPTPDVGVDSDGVPFVRGGESASYPGYFYPATVYGAPWSGSAEVDGCPHEPNFDPDACTCVLITDQFTYSGFNAGRGYYAVLSDLTDGGGNYRDFPSGLVPVAELPRPVILSTHRVGDSVLVSVGLESLGPGLYLDPACGGCAPVGFKIMGHDVGRLEAAPVDRVDGWTELTLADGVTPQGITPIDGHVDLFGFCSGGERSLYIAAKLFFADGHEATHLSANAPKIECGPNLAEPGDPRVRPVRPTAKGPRPGKGGRR